MSMGTLRKSELLFCKNGVYKSEILGSRPMGCLNAGKFRLLSIFETYNYPG